MKRLLYPSGTIFHVGGRSLVVGDYAHHDIYRTTNLFTNETIELSTDQEYDTETPTNTWLTMRGDDPNTLYPRGTIVRVNDFPTEYMIVSPFLKESGNVTEVCYRLAYPDFTDEGWEYEYNLSMIRPADLYANLIYTDFGLVCRC